jgi:hypothetical protein
MLHILSVWRIRQIDFQPYLFTHASMVHKYA